MKKKPFTAITRIGGVTPLDRHQRRQQRGDRHQQRHRDAVGAGEGVRRAEAEHSAERRRRQQPVHQRHIDLADLIRWRCGAIRMRGRKPSWTACCVSENAPEMIACDAITVATVASRRPAGNAPQSGASLIERVVDRVLGR
jgi:hypothetical protein